MIDLQNNGDVGFRKSWDACEKTRYGYYMGMYGVYHDILEHKNLSR